MKTHYFNLDIPFRKELKASITNKKALHYISNGLSERDAKKRAKQELMPIRKWKAFARITKAILSFYDHPANNHYMNVSTNRHGEHSWYIYPEVQFLRVCPEYTKAKSVDNVYYSRRFIIRISDHNRHNKENIKSTEGIQIDININDTSSVIDVIKKIKEFEQSGITKDLYMMDCDSLTYEYMECDKGMINNDLPLIYEQ